MSKLRAWLMEPRPPFLLLTVCLVSLGTVTAWQHGFFNLFYFALTFGGLMLIHISVNVLNDYFDYKSGLDLETVRTPFSGGSGILPSKMLTPRNVYTLGISSLLVALFIGTYFIIFRGLLLIPILIVAVISTYFYSTHISKLPIGEFIAGLNFGPLMILGTYFVQTGMYSLEPFVVSLIPGILGMNLLVINEIPDMEADRRVGRRHLAIILGRKKASRLFSTLLVTAYLCIIGGVSTGLMPIPTLIGLASLPFGLKAMKGALKNYDDVGKLVPAMAMNVITLLLTQALLVVGYVLAILLQI